MRDDNSRLVYSTDPNSTKNGSHCHDCGKKLAKCKCKKTKATSLVDSTANTSGAAMPKNNKLTDINKMRIQKEFIMAMAVDVDFTTEQVSVTYVPSHGNTINRVLKDPTIEAFVDTLVEVTDTAHEAIKSDIAANGENLILKVASLSGTREPILAKLASSNKDRKKAITLKDVIIAEQVAKAAKIAELKLELDALTK